MDSDEAQQPQGRPNNPFCGLRWLGTPEDQKKVPPRVRKGKEGREAKKG
jgi:hypothetical protein